MISVKDRSSLVWVSSRRKISKLMPHVCCPSPPQKVRVFPLNFDFHLLVLFIPFSSLNVWFCYVLKFVGHFFTFVDKIWLRFLKMDLVVDFDQVWIVVDFGKMELSVDLIKFYIVVNSGRWIRKCIIYVWLLLILHRSFFIFLGMVGRCRVFRICKIYPFSPFHLLLIWLYQRSKFVIFFRLRF